MNNASINGRAGHWSTILEVKLLAKVQFKRRSLDLVALESVDEDRCHVR